MHEFLWWFALAVLVSVEPFFSQPVSAAANLVMALGVIPLFCARAGASASMDEPPRPHAAVSLGFLFALVPCPTLLPHVPGAPAESLVSWLISYPLLCAFCYCLARSLQGKLQLARLDLAMAVSIFTVVLWVLSDLLGYCAWRYELWACPAQVQPLFLWLAMCGVLQVPDPEPEADLAAADSDAPIADSPLPWGSWHEERLESLDDLLSASQSYSGY